VVNERDELGSDLVPGYLTSVRDGSFYGWPYSYWGGRVDRRVEPPRPGLVATALAPDYALSVGDRVGTCGADAASDRGVRSGRRHGDRHARLMESQAAVRLQGGLRELRGHAAGQWRAARRADRLVDTDGNARGRPVGVALDGRGALLVADDVGNVVWRVTAR
jgi:glucose/arabinose dehydrogenase